MRDLHFKVLNVLQNKPDTRNSDYLLWIILCKSENPIAMHMPFDYVICHRKELGLPNFGSVGRIRRKIQEEHPELRADTEVKRQRDIKEEQYREYARGK